jgi:hypothetical protein
MSTIKRLVVLLAMVLISLSTSAIAQDMLTYGSKVLSHDIDEGRALSPFYVGPEFAFVDLNNNGIIEPDDPVYIHIDPTVSRVSENDVRITPFGDFSAGVHFSAGSKVKATDPDHGKELKKFGSGRFPSAEFRYFDVDGDKGYSIEDPVYLDLNPGMVSAGDVRITGYKEYAAGSRVRDSDADSDKPTVTLPGMLCFYNTDGNINNGGWAIYSAADLIYVDTQYPFYSVTPNDIRISE